MAISSEELEDLYGRRYAGFRRGAAVIVNDFDLAHDVVQDGFAAAFAERNRFRGGTPEAWVWRIVERKAFDVRRTMPRHAAHIGDDFDAALIPRERNPELAAAVAALPPRRRLVVFLRYFADLSYADIAQTCRISEGTVAATLSQALEALRPAIEREEVEQ